MLQPVCDLHEQFVDTDARRESEANETPRLPDQQHFHPPRIALPHNY